MSDDLNYGSGLPWWTSQSPTSGFQRTLLDLPSLLPKEKPLITTSRIQLLLARGLRRKKNLILQDLRSPKNAKEIAEQVQSVHTKSEVFVDISTVDLFTIRWQRCSTLCCETPITQINSYSQFDTRTFWGLAIFNWFHDNSCTGLSAQHTKVWSKEVVGGHHLLTNCVVKSSWRFFGGIDDKSTYCLFYRLICYLAWVEDLYTVKFTKKSFKTSHNFERASSCSLSIIWTSSGQFW